MKRCKVYLVEDEMLPFELEPNPIRVDELRLRFRETRLEIGWAEVEQMTEGRLEVKMTLVGSYIIGEGLAPDLAEFKGTIPTSLRKG